MYKIQEVVHKFRSGSMSEKKSEGEEAAGPGLSSQATGIMAAIHTFANSSTPASDEVGRETLSKWYTEHADSLSSNLPLSEKAGLSSLPVITPAGLQQTKLATGQGCPPDPVSALPASLTTAVGQGSPSLSSPGPLPASPDRKLGKTRPQGTLDYRVGKNDTLEKIAAHFDVTPSELKKLNRLSFHMVFENQVLYIPDPNYVPSEPPTPEPLSPAHTPLNATPRLDLPVVKMAERSSLKVPGSQETPPPPASAPPLPIRSPFSPFSLARFFTEGGDAQPAKEEQLERFVKLSAQMISEGFEKIPGTLLVTPNAIMFEPDVTDDRVIEEGTEHYGAVVYMDTLLSAAIYQDLSALRFHTRCSSENDLLEKPEVYHGDVRARSASTSSLLTPKPCSGTSGSNPQPVPASKNMADLFLQSTAAPPWGSAKAGDMTVFPISPLLPSGESPGAGTAGTEGAHNAETERGYRQPEDRQTEDVRDGSKPSTDSLSSLSMTPDSASSMGRLNTGSQAMHVAQDRAQDGEVDVCDASTTLTSHTSSNTAGESQTKHTPSVRVEQSGQSNSPAVRVEQSGQSNSPAVRMEQSGQSNSPAVQTDGKDSSNLLVNKRAQDVVEEILEAVSSGDVLPTEAQKVVGAGTTQDRGTGVQDIDKDGEERRIGSIVYLPVEESSQGQVIVRNADSVISGDSADPSRARANGKHRPPPLTIFGVDAADGASPTVTDGRRSRALSETFSPLRSSAQHLSNFVNYATGFFRSSNDDRTTVKDVHDIPAAQEGSLATPDSDGGKEKDGQGSGSKGQSSECRFMNAVKVEERPELFRKISDLIPPHEDVHKQPALFLHLRVDTEACDRRVAASTPCEAHRHQTTRPHYWFSVPRNKGDHLYAFFIHWRPDLYGDDDINPEDRGFVVVDRVDVTEQPESLPFLDDHFGPQLSSSFKKDWEIVSREELRRRASLIQDMDLNIMPELSEASSIMSDDQIMELTGKLPARTVGYQWTLVYSTGQHGFSLQRLYRQLSVLDSPILLVLQDTMDTVFGAYMSDPPRRSDHFYGTGTCQLWTFRDKLQVFGWSGNNPYFIRGDENSLSVGASQGTYGLWLDNDLYHGHSQHCTTFHNCVLSSSEDFILRNLEAWAFLDC